MWHTPPPHADATCPPTTSSNASAPDAPNRYPSKHILHWEKIPRMPFCLFSYFSFFCLFAFFPSFVFLPFCIFFHFRPLASLFFSLTPLRPFSLSPFIPISSESFFFSSFLPSCPYITYTTPNYCLFTPLYSSIKIHTTYHLLYSILFFLYLHTFHPSDIISPACHFV